jgi:hypothetical protein
MPLSLPAASVGVGGVGGDVSMVMANGAEAAETFPAGSVVAAVILCRPSLRVRSEVTDQIPATTEPVPIKVVPSNRAMVSPSVPVPVSVG